MIDSIAILIIFMVAFIILTALILWLKTRRAGKSGPIIELEKLVKCRSCGSLVPEGVRKCAFCGALQRHDESGE